MNDEEAAPDIRRSAMLLREAQSVRRRVDRLVALAGDAPPESKRLLDEVVDAVERLTDDLARHQRAETRRVQQALRGRGGR